MRSAPQAPLAAALLPLALVALLARGGAAGERPEYPPTRVQEVVDDYHGTKVSDPYRWLEDGKSPEVRQWIDAQNALTRRLLDRFPERVALRASLEKLWTTHVATPPDVRGRRWFYQRRQGLRNQPLVYVRDGGRPAPERVLLDPNAWSADGTVAMDWSYPSRDGARFAYGRSAAGSELSTLRVIDVASGRELADSIANMRAASVAWLPDNSGFYYSRYPAPGTVPSGDEYYFRRIYLHRLGTDAAQDAYVAGEGRPKEEWTDVAASSDGGTVFLSRSLDWAKNDLFFRRLDGGTEFTPIAVGLDGQVQGDARGRTLYLRTNVGAPRYRIVKASFDRPGPDGWTDLVPEGEGVIEGFALAGDRLLVQVLENAHARLFIHALDGRRLAEVALPTLGSISGLSADPDRPEAYFQFSSYAYPNAVLRLDARSGKLETMEQLDVGVDLAGFETQQLWCTSQDGTRVPLFLVARRGQARDGKSALRLTGYGGFEISSTPEFSRNLIPWLERGGLFAEVCLRGGGEFGRAWHEAGRLEHKQNVFDDFIAAAESLVSEGWTSRARLAIEGGSNGGLLTGAAVVQRPELFQAAIVAVPLLDMLRYQDYSIARLWIPEYGTSEDPKQFPFLYAYSPYHHVQPGTDYPAVLLTAGDSDSRVEPMHARKMAARLQAATSGTRPILLLHESRAGHGQGKPLSKQLDERLDILTFLLWQTGMIPEPPVAPVASPVPAAGGTR